MRRLLTLAMLLAMAPPAHAESTGPAVGESTPTVANPVTSESAPPLTPPPPKPKAKGAALPDVPDIGDEPLPEWKPPPPDKRRILFLSLSPEMRRAQQMRQAGLWLASAGGVTLLAGGIVWALAVDANTDLSAGIIAGTGGVITNNKFHPELEDKRDRFATAGVSLFTIGAVLTGGGLLLFGYGQYQLAAWHKRHPGDPLPALSGY
jgi:hypothetical protein